MAFTEVNERQRLTQTWRTSPSTALFYIVKNMSFKRYRNTVYLLALMEGILIHLISFHWSWAEDGSKSWLRESVTWSRAGRTNILGPCLSMVRNAGWGAPEQKIRQPVVHRVQPEFKTLQSVSKIFPKDYYGKVNNSSLPFQPHPTILIPPINFQPIS